MKTDPWDEYAVLQKRIGNRDKIDALTWAHEEQANELLNSSMDGNLPIDSQKRSKVVKNLAINRRRKHLHRQFLLERNAAILTPTRSSPESVVITRLTLEFLRAMVTTPQRFPRMTQ